ncbi:hypothetical protein GXW82_08700 [Streptacidiphilus sp. 4-A2]|nr:hypothetical protein [Streptacidiphilus sp. 4-A2]
MFPAAHAQVIGTHLLTDTLYDESTINTEAGNSCQAMAGKPPVDQSKLGVTANVIYFTPPRTTGTTSTARSPAPWTTEPATSSSARS